MSTRIRLHNLAPKTTEKQLRRLIAPLGTVVSVEISPRIGPEGQMSAVVELATEEQALYLALVLDGRRSSGRVLQVRRLDVENAAGTVLRSERYARTENWGIR